MYYLKWIHESTSVRRRTCGEVYYDLFSEDQPVGQPNPAIPTYKLYKRMVNQNEKD